MNDPEVVAYIAIRNPKNTVQYGGVVAAPLVKEVLTECFSVLDIPMQEGGIPLNARYWIDQKTYDVKNYVGQNVHRITQPNNYSIVIQGDGDVVLAQLPSAGELIVEGGTVILYT